MVTKWLIFYVFAIYSILLICKERRRKGSKHCFRLSCWHRAMWMDSISIFPFYHISEWLIYLFHTFVCVDGEKMRFLHVPMAFMPSATTTTTTVNGSPFFKHSNTLTSHCWLWMHWTGKTKCSTKESHSPFHVNRWLWIWMCSPLENRIKGTTVWFTFWLSGDDSPHFRINFALSPPFYQMTK